MFRKGIPILYVKKAKAVKAHWMYSHLKYSLQALISMLFLFVWSKRVWNNSMLSLTLAAFVPNLMNLLSCYIANVFTSPSFSTRRSNSSDKEEDLAETSGVTN